VQRRAASTIIVRIETSREPPLQGKNRRLALLVSRRPRGAKAISLTSRRIATIRSCNFVGDLFDVRRYLILESARSAAAAGLAEQELDRSITYYDASPVKPPTVSSSTNKGACFAGLQNLRTLDRRRSALHRLRSTTLHSALGYLSRRRFLGNGVREPGRRESCRCFSPWREGAARWSHSGNSS